MSVNTNELMDIALELSGLEKIPWDSGIIVEGDHIENVLVGLDMETPELILAKDLGYDCVVGHHPNAGDQVANFSKVMDRQIEIMVKFGVPINKAQKALRKKQALVAESSHSQNHDRAASAAMLIGMPYMNIHIPGDIVGENLVQDFLDSRFESGTNARLKDVIKALGEIPEYSGRENALSIRVGSGDDYCGRIAVLFAGGTNGGADVFKAYFDAGVGTIICMHIPDDVKKAVQEQNIGNVIVAQHIYSDSIGMNKIIEKWVQKRIKVTKISGIL